MQIKDYTPKRGRIEIIPMIDVVFFLLVFSMLSSLALAAIETEKVNLPTAAHGQTGTPARVFVTLTSDQRLFINRRQVDNVEQLTQELKAQIGRNPEIFVIINCDKNNTWGEFRALVGAAYKADPKNLAIMTRSKESGQPQA